jgi:hypothetical protein
VPFTSDSFLHLIDYPFSFRYRLDGNVLVVKDVKVGGLAPATVAKGEVALLQGRWTKKVDTGRDAER